MSQFKKSFIMLSRLCACLLFLTTIHPLSSYRIRGRSAFKGFGSARPFGVETPSDFFPVNYGNFGSVEQGDRRFGLDRTPTSYFQKPRFGRWINQLSEQRSGRSFGRRRHHWGKRHFRPHSEEEEEVLPVRRRFRHGYHSRLRHKRHRRGHSIFRGIGVVRQIPLSEGVLSEDEQHLDFNGAQFPIVSENNAPLVAVLEISSDLQAPQSSYEDRDDSQVRVIYYPETQNIGKRRREKVVFAPNDESQISEQPSFTPQEQSQVVEQPSFVFQEIPQTENQTSLVAQEVPEVTNQPTVTPQENPEVTIDEPKETPQVNEQSPATPQELPQFPQLSPEPQAPASNEANQVIDQTPPAIQQTPAVASQEDIHNFDTSYDFKLKGKTGQITIRSPKKSNVALEDTVQITLK